MVDRFVPVNRLLRSLGLENRAIVARLSKPRSEATCEQLRSTSANVLERSYIALVERKSITMVDRFVPVNRLLRSLGLENRAIVARLSKPRSEATCEQLRSTSANVLERNYIALVERKSITMVDRFVPVNRLLRSLGLENRAIVARLSKPRSEATCEQLRSTSANVLERHYIALVERKSITMVDRFVPVNRLLRSLGLENRAIVARLSKPRSEATCEQLRSTSANVLERNYIALVERKSITMVDRFVPVNRLLRSLGLENRATMDCQRRPSDRRFPLATN